MTMDGEGQSAVRGQRHLQQPDPGVDAVRWGVGDGLQEIPQLVLRLGGPGLGRKGGPLRSRGTEWTPPTSDPSQLFRQRSPSPANTYATSPTGGPPAGVALGGPSTPGRGGSGGTPAVPRPWCGVGILGQAEQDAVGWTSLLVGKSGKTTSTQRPNQSTTKKKTQIQMLFFPCGYNQDPFFLYAASLRRCPSS